MHGKGAGQARAAADPAVNADVVVDAFLFGEEAGIDVVPVRQLIRVGTPKPDSDRARHGTETAKHGLADSTQAHLNFIGSSLSGPFSFVLHRDQLLLATIRQQVCHFMHAAAASGHW